MKENQKEESEQTNQVHTKKSGSLSKKPPATEEHKNPKEGEEFIREGHGHDYSVPFAGEDGETEDQSENQNRDMSKPTEQGKIPGENSTI